MGIFVLLPHQDTDQAVNDVSIAGNVFPVVDAIYFWFLKFTGRLLNETLGKWNFWIMFVGFNLGFFPMHIAGLLGMPRRIYTYNNGMGWDTINLIETIGAYVFAFGLLHLLVNVFISRRNGRTAGLNPWDAPTPEWAVPSPPPEYNFEVIPIVASRHPLWEDRLKDTKSRSKNHEGLVLDHGREIMGTTALDSEPNVILRMPGDSFAPILLALSLTTGFVGLLVHWWWLAAAGAIAAFLTMLLWL